MERSYISHAAGCQAMSLVFLAPIFENLDTAGKTTILVLVAVSILWQLAATVFTYVAVTKKSITQTPVSSDE